jgi:hypothetical protein
MSPGSGGQISSGLCARFYKLAISSSTRQGNWCFQAIVDTLQRHPEIGSRENAAINSCAIYPDLFMTGEPADRPISDQNHSSGFIQATLAG